MATNKKVSLSDEVWGKIADKLSLLVGNSSYNTTSTYTSNAEKYPDNILPFVDKHIDYLHKHPNINPEQYIANLKMKTRV